MPLSTPMLSGSKVKPLADGRATASFSAATAGPSIGGQPNESDERGERREVRVLLAEAAHEQLHARLAALVLDVGEAGLGADRGRIIAAAGPMIRQPSYEVGQDMIERFIAVDKGYARFFAPGARPGHAQFDLPGFIGAAPQSQQAGH